MFQPRSVPVLLEVAVILVSSIVVLPPNGNFWIVPLLNSANGMSHHTQRARARFLGRFCGTDPALNRRQSDSLWQHLYRTRLTEKWTNNVWPGMFNWEFYNKPQLLITVTSTRNPPNRKPPVPPDIWSFNITPLSYYVTNSDRTCTT